MGQPTKTVRAVTIRIPRGKNLSLSARARFVWARLVRLPFPASAAKLVGWCGRLVGRSDGLAAALVELKEKNLVEHGPRGWIALPPSGEVMKEFDWPPGLAHLSRWQDRYGYTSVTVPVDYPFNDFKKTKTVKGKTKYVVTPQNALEVWLVWEMLEGRPRDDLPGPSLLKYRLGISRNTARTITADIKSFNGVFDKDGDLRGLGVKRQSHTVNTDPVDKVLEEVGVPEASRQPLRDKADELKLTNTKLIRLIRKACAKHDADEYGDDPTPMIRTFLKAEAGFKSKGRGAKLQKPAGI